MNTEVENMPRSRQLMADTDSLHEEIHALVDQFGPFKVIENYGPWVEAQYVFQGQLLELYNNDDVKTVLPDAGMRSRLQAAAKDLEHLGRKVPSLPEKRVFPDVPLVEALAWLFVSEGSTLGAATLIKRAEALGLGAEKGASHLAAESPAIRAKNWKHFTAVIDGLKLSEEEEKLMTESAQQAFRNFLSILQQSFASV